MRTKLKKVIFLDRDGVINRDYVDYVKSWSEYEFLPGSIEAIRLLKENGFAVIIITNQSAINRGIITLQTLQDIHSRMRAAIRSGGGDIMDIFFCPHAPEDNCDCRKPKPGMIFSARDRYHIDLADSCMVGDTARDIECGRNAGCGRTILVRTGNGLASEKILNRGHIYPDFVATDLYTAVNWILDHEPSTQRSAHHH